MVALKFRHWGTSVLKRPGEKRETPTSFWGSLQLMLSVSMARIIAFMAMKMFWQTILMKLRLSSSEQPEPWMILICFMKVLLPLSPVPGGRNRCVIRTTQHVNKRPIVASKCSPGLRGSPELQIRFCLNWVITHPYFNNWVFRISIK